MIISPLSFYLAGRCWIASESFASGHPVLLLIRLAFPPVKFSGNHCTNGDQRFIGDILTCFQILSCNHREAAVITLEFSQGDGFTKKTVQNL